MGCSDDKQKIQEQITLLKLERMKIQTQKDKELKKLSEIEGKELKRICVPDYVDPEFAKANNIVGDGCCIIVRNNKKEDNKQDKSKKEIVKTENDKDNKKSQKDIKKKK